MLPLRCSRLSVPLSCCRWRVRSRKMRRDKPRALKTAVFPTYPPPEGKTWYSTTEGVTIPIAPMQRELALKNLEEQGLPRPAQFDDEPGGSCSDPGDDPESPGRSATGYVDVEGERTDEDLSGEKRRRGCCRCSRGDEASGAALPGVAEGSAESGVRPGCWGNLAALLSLLNPIAATGCAGLCLPATTGLLASVGSFLGLGVGGGQIIVAYGTLVLLYAATLSVGHSAKVRPPSARQQAPHACRALQPSRCRFAFCAPAYACAVRGGCVLGAR